MGTVSFTVDTSGVEAALQGRADRIINSLVRRTTAIDESLQAKITGEKLSGQVLHQRTGKLIGSVRTIPVTNDGATIAGGVQAGGGPAYYAVYQNYGTAGPYEIRPIDPKGVLVFLLDGKTVFAKRVMHPGLPARNFMESTLEESRAGIISSLQSAVDEA
jgi:hypothetical protein